VISTFQKRIENEMTPIVAFGLIALACIFVFLALSTFEEKTRFLQNEVKTAQADLVTLQNLQGDDVWTQRLEKSQAELRNVNFKVWQGSSSGVISAYLEETLTKTLNQMRAERTIVSVDPNLQQLNDLNILSFNMRGQLPSHLAVVDIIELIEGNERNIWLNDTAISFDATGKATFSTTGFIPVNISERARK